MKRKEIKQLIEKIDNEEKLLKMEIGKDRYKEIVTKINEILQDNDLSPIHSKQLFNHLSDIFQVEQIHV
ncbi:hypothetical protein CN469_11950 [Bacillus cereus]|nr:hypothetical protein CN469_11950 [Bacillus cereus]